jgi:hypothetical protein
LIHNNFARSDHIVSAARKKQIAGTLAKNPDILNPLLNALKEADACSQIDTIFVSRYIVEAIGQDLTDAKQYRSEIK